MFKNLFRRQPRPDLAAEIMESAAKAAMAPPAEDPSNRPCDECGSIFLFSKMKLVLAISLRDNNNPLPSIRWEVKHYCPACAPAYTISLALADDQGTLHTLAFRPEDGWMAQIDPFTGEEEYPVSLADYHKAYCEACGDSLTPKKCTTCRS